MADFFINALQGAVGGILVMLVWWLSTRKAVIRARRIELVNEEGKVRALLAVCDAHKAGLVLMDEAGRPRLALQTMRDSSPGIYLYDTSSRVRASIGLSAEDAPGLAFLDAENHPRVILSATRDGAPHFGLFDEEGVERAWMEIPEQASTAEQAMGVGQSKKAA